MSAYLAAKAYAKINLVLAVGPKLANNYHLIKSVMQSVSLADELTFKPDANLELTGDLSGLKEENLIFKAAKALQIASHTNYGAEIQLQKNIPIAAGLGGGSADAAATLIGLNQLWGLNFSLEQLKKVASGIGSDVPFCLEGGTQLVSGWGEKVEKLPFLPLTNLWLVKVNTALSAAQIYQLFDKLKAKTGADSSLEKLLTLWRLSPNEVYGKLAMFLKNDLEEAVFQLAPLVKKVKEKLLACSSVKACLVSGSGPTLIVWFNKHMPEAAVRKIVRQEAEVWEIAAVPQGVAVSNSLATETVKVLNAG